MKKTTIVIILAVAVVLLVIGGYNRFVTLSQAIDGQWAQVETQYQRRFDLIPNLVSSVQGFMRQEREVFENLAKARSAYSGARSVDEKAQAASQVEGALGRLLAIFENYPQLRSSETVINLMTELAGTENRVSVERRRFNDLVRDYNTAIKRFPSNLLAKLFGFAPRAFFEASEGAAQAPKVSL